MSQAQTINGPLFVNGDLTVAGNINKGALTQLQNTTKAQAAALGAMPTLTQIDQGFTNPTAGTNQGTPTPATLAAPTVVAFYDSNQISWIAQTNLRWLSSYNIQVSVDNLNWYSLDQSGANANGLGVLNAVTTCSDPRILHQNIKFAASPPTAGILLYYRVRQVTVLGVVGSWSPASSGTAVPIQGASQILAASILGTNIAANTITADRMVATYLQFAASLGSQYNAVPNPGDLRTLLMNPQNPLSGEAGYVNIDQYAADGSGWSQNLFSIEPSTTGNANVLDLFISGRLFARDSLLSAPGRFFSLPTSTPFGSGAVSSLASGYNSATGIIYFVAGAGNVTLGDYVIAYSTNGGLTWTAATGDPFSATGYTTSLVKSLVYCGNGIFIASGYNGHTGATGVSISTNYGVSWGALNALPTFNSMSCDGNGNVVGVTGAGAIYYSSNNGTSWTLATSNPFGGFILETTWYGNGKFFAAGTGYKLAYSTNAGVTWSSLVTTPLTGGTYIYSGSFGNGISIIGGDKGQIARSIDGGLTWALITNPFPNTDNIEMMCYGPGLFLAGSVGSSSGGSVTRSLDLGLTWGVTYLGGNVIAPIGSGVNAGTIAFNGKIVIGGGGTITVPIAYSDYVEAGAGIVNSGSNSNGSFVQFADGTMICYHYDTALTVTSSGGTPMCYNQATRTFAAAFLSGTTPTVVPGSQGNSSLSWPGSCSAVTATNFDEVLMGSVLSSTGYMNYVAYGKWR